MLAKLAKFQNSLFFFLQKLYLGENCTTIIPLKQQPLNSKAVIQKASVQMQKGELNSFNLLKLLIAANCSETMSHNDLYN